MKASRKRLTASLAAALAVALGLGVAALAQGGNGMVFLPGASNGPMGDSGQPTHPAHTPEPTAPPHPTDPGHPTEPVHPTATAGHVAGCDWPPELYPRDSVVMSLERTPCFGACPEYLVEVYGDGRVVYEGRRFVAVEGRQEATIASADVESLIEAFYSAPFFGFRDYGYGANIFPCFLPNGDVEACSQLVTDLPSQIVTYRAAGYLKTVDDYWGAPEALKLLENKIDEVAGTEKWVRGPRPTP